MNCVVLYLYFFYFGKLDDLTGLSLMIVVQISPLLTYYLPIKKQKSNYSITIKYQIKTKLS